MSGIIQPGKNQIYEWSAPIPYGSVVFHGGGLFSNTGTFYHDASVRKDNGTLFNGSTWRWVPELGRWGVHGDADLSQHVQWTPGIQPTTYSFFCWFKMPTPQSTSEHGNDSIFRTTLGQHRGFGISIRSSTADRFVVHVRDNTGTVHGHTPTFPNTGDWIHAGGVVVANDYFTRYVNGVPRHTYSIGTPEWHSQVCYLCRGGSGYVTVTVADMLLTRTALSPPQVAWLSKRENNPWKPWRRKSWLVPTALANPFAIDNNGVITIADAEQLTVGDDWTVTVEVEDSAGATAQGDFTIQLRAATTRPWLYGRRQSKIHGGGIT